METISQMSLLEIWEEIGTAPKLIAMFFFIIASVGQWRLYAKANQPGYAIFIPIYNLIVFLRIIGRPAGHVWFFFIPVFNIFFIVKVWFETCDSFGKSTTLDYALIIIFNFFYILNMGLAYDIEYVGPSYKKGNAEEDFSSETQFA